MAQPNKTAKKGTQDQASIIDQLLELAKQQSPKSKTEKGASPSDFALDFTNWVKEFYRHAPQEELAHNDLHDLYGAALSLWRYAKDIFPNASGFRLFNPKPEIHGWTSNHTVLEVVHHDMPFLVDSIVQLLSDRGLSIHRLLHPVLSLGQDKNYSLMHIELDHVTDEAQIASLEAEIKVTLTDVEQAVHDWPAMMGCAKSTINGLSECRLNTGNEVTKTLGLSEETETFIDWLCQNHFTFLGVREFRYDQSAKQNSWSINPDKGLGILKDTKRRIFEHADDVGTLPEALQQQLMSGDQLRVIKANERSRVHRRANLDVILIKRYEQDGKKGNPVLVGQMMFAGLFTSNVYSSPATSIPYVRVKLRQVIDTIGFAAQGHDAKTLDHILETYPRDELFQISTDALTYNAKQIVYLGQRPRPAVLLRADPFKRHVSALAFLPRERFSSDLRKRVGEMLSEAVGGEVATYSTQLSQDPLALVIYILKTQPSNLKTPDLEGINRALINECRDWRDLLREGLHEQHGEEEGNRLFNLFSESFPTGYQEETAIAIALHDVEALDQLLNTNDQSDAVSVHLSQPVTMEPHQLRVKLFRLDHLVVLSQIVPILENMGVKVISEHPWKLNLRQSPTPANEEASEWRQAHIHDFYLETEHGNPIDIDAVREHFHDVLLNIWHGVAENDGFNRLILHAGLNWRQVMVIRAYAKYLRQARIPFSQDYMQNTFHSNPQITRLLTELFDIRFDPALDDQQREAGAKQAIETIEQALEEVTSLDEDRILRRFLNLICNTLRTNYFQQDEAGQPKRQWLSLKFDSQKLVDLPEPAPLREIYVYSPQFEAVHLRFGLVARGGLRWSDRPEDFRTEILGLVKAQQVKNAVIVPVGSKGGFVLKQAAGLDRDAFRAEGVKQYQSFITAILEITDNLVQGAVQPPAKVVRHDGDDPYLVVAADKGTATFSDHANQISQAQGFWLGDAFASGGSAGYDHKQMGITAKGGWEAVKRHFRELGHDTQTMPFSVTGVGDMGGDVFGNGMLLSDQICLKVAFNHLHIFIDPNPDPTTSFVERKRLFEGVLGWDHYDQSLLSKGGCIFERSQKSLTLTPEIKAMLACEEDQLSPTLLINRLLKMPVDLLWFGGIGTYVKQTRESHAEVGDRANDAIRVNAAELNCRVIGEGANLGVTQLARVEFALRGGAVNTDAIDNSAGVDCSDHEVNIKILLGNVVEKGDMTEKQRNTLLEAMTDEVSDLVLRDNYQQTGSLSVCQSLASNNLDRHRRLLKALERSGHLDRGLEFLPDEDELDSRAQQKTGLTRPELAVLFAYVKNVAYKTILQSDLVNDPWLEEDLQRYFPTELREHYKDEITNHKLRNEIIATALTNSMINRAGLDFVNEQENATGASTDAITKAYIIVREVFDLRALWQAIEAHDGTLPTSQQYRMLYETRRTTERMTGWFLRHHLGSHHDSSSANIEDIVNRYRPALQEFKQNIDNILPQDELKALHTRQQLFAHDGMDQTLSNAIGSLKLLSSVCDLVRLQSYNDQWSITELGQCYHRIGVRFSLDYLRTAANRLQAGQSNWNRLALAAVIDDLWTLQFTLTRNVTTNAPQSGNQSGQSPFDAWLQQDKERLSRIDGLLHDMVNLPSLDLAMLSVALRELRAFIGD